MTGGAAPGGGAGDQLDPAPDKALARQAQRGDASALEQLVRRYVRPVHAIAASYIAEPADAEDAAQETFLRVLGGIETYDPDQPFAPWLYQIARNVARNHLAAGARRQADVISDNVSSGLPGPDAVLERSEIRALVDAAISRLPERQRTAFYLCDVEGYVAAEVATMMDVSPGTVRSHVHHARMALRAALAQSFEQAENTGE